jgi:hypothetical protein
MTQLTLKAINTRRGKHALAITSHKEELLVEVALHNWVRSERPSAFSIPNYEGWGRLDVTVTAKDDEGMQFMTIMRKRDQFVFPEVDVNDELFKIEEQFGG